MRRFECSKCGWCCTELEPTTSDAPGGLLLFAEETALFTGDNAKLVKPTLAYSAPGTDDKSVIMYGMIDTCCPLYEPDVGCTVYEQRPMVCRKFPLGTKGLSLHPRCIAAGEATSTPLVLRGAQKAWSDKHKAIMADIPKHSTFYIYNFDDDMWDSVGVIR